MENTAFHKHSRLNDEERTAFRLWLQRQFTERCKRNARYSLRAFAKVLEINPSSLSQILSGTRPISKDKMMKICTLASATPKDLRTFGLLQDQESDVGPTYSQLSIDRFAVISDWYHYALVELTCVSGFKSDSKWIARKLSITVEEAKAAIQRLKRVGLLIEENGKLIRSKNHFTNQADVDTSGAHRELQKQIIEKALLAVEECSPEEKDITSMTMSIDKSNLGKARELIRKFRRDLCNLLEEGEQVRVYNLAIQLYPISTRMETI